jgi:hypothetical protein
MGNGDELVQKIPEWDFERIDKRFYRILAFSQSLIDIDPFLVGGIFNSFGRGQRQCDREANHGGRVVGYSHCESEIK